MCEVRLWEDDLSPLGQDLCAGSTHVAAFPALPKGTYCPCWFQVQGLDLSQVEYWQRAGASILATTGGSRCGSPPTCSSEYQVGFVQQPQETVVLCSLFLRKSEK